MSLSALHSDFLEKTAHALVGRTPLLTLNYRYLGRLRRVYVKAEHFNLTGSVKDRMALHILRRAYERGVLKPGDPIAEATSGNTGISFAALGRALGHPVTIFMPNWMSQERKDLIQSLGASIRLVSHREGGFLGSVRLSQEMKESNPACFLPSQFSNEDNVAAHRESTGPEIQFQLAQMGLRPEAFVAGVGTGGTVMGVGSYLRESFPAVGIHPLEPANSPTLSTGYKVGKHRIQGISDEFIPDIVKLEKLDDVVSVDDGDAIIMAQMLAAQLGLAVGISSGANLLGAIKIQEQMGGDAVVVTLFPDDNKKYLSTDLMREEPVKPAFLSPFIELVSYEATRRFTP
ncbi:cysteine synthase [Geothrix limicola]|uniref:Cysteine synthase n=1 Tax=Geothrix limicola TaxID=2927978 RepID=A0ABQ5QFI0_9BACT|nr:cysteine synthase family protein [Geothrix limicola]GLH73448.1 cysteine synthase [Geothrix limicola]